MTRLAIDWLSSPTRAKNISISLADLKTALDHHYTHNAHHPEHYPNGIDGMSLFDLTEMLMDWKAASERHPGGTNIVRSVEIGSDRFSVGEQLKNFDEHGKGDGLDLTSALSQRLVE